MACTEVETLRRGGLCLLWLPFGPSGEAYALPENAATSGATTSLPGFLFVLFCFLIFEGDSEDVLVVSV